jgi:hypothetical protein
MLDNTPRGGEAFFPPEDMVTASELREFVFCERAWFLSRQGLQVSARAEAQRAEGIEFHEARAGAASRGGSPRAFWWPVVLAAAGIAILLFEFWKANR